MGEEEQGLVVKGGVTVAATVQKLETSLSDAPILSPVNRIQTNKQNTDETKKTLFVFTENV